MDNLRACRRCGAVVTIYAPCKCKTGSADQMVPVQDRREQSRRPPGRPAQPSNHQGRPKASKWPLVVFFCIVAGLGLCGTFIWQSNSNYSPADREANAIAMTQRTDYPLWTCAVMLDRFGQVVDQYEAAGHARQSANIMAMQVKAGEKGLSNGVYAAQLERCSELWRSASEPERIAAMRKAGL